MRHTRNLLIATGLFIVAITPGFANGIYVGGGVGAAYVEDSPITPSGATFDESSTSAYRLFGGYRFDALPIVSVSGELGYRDLGSLSAGSLEYGVSGFDYSVLAGLGLGPVEVYARVGAVQYDLEKIASGLKTEYDGTAPLYGIGASFKIFSLGARAEYEVMDVDELEKSDTVWLSVFYQF